MITERISRRALLGASAGALLGANLWPGALRAADGPPSSFRFFCINDLHCEDDECARWIERSVVSRLKMTEGPIDFCLLLGDLAERGTRAELAPVRELFGALGIAVHAVPGNHDYLTTGGREAYDDLFPKQLNYTFEHKGWQLVALDTTQGTQYQQTAIGPETLKWLDEQLPKLDRSRPMIVFTHFPLGERVTYRPKNAEEVLGRFVEHNLRGVLSGHFHGLTERTVRGATLTTNRCCALKRTNHDRTKEKGYFLCEVREGKLSRQFVEVAAT